MNFLRLTTITLALAAAGIAHAAEISERPAPMSAKSRTLVAAEARTAMPTNEIWDGREAREMSMSTASRDQVRRDAAMKTAPSQVALRGDFVGGM